MTRRNDDRQRSVTIGFRVNKEQAERIDLLVALSGKTKQDYILERLENESMEVIPSPRMQRTLRDEMRKLCVQLERLKAKSRVSAYWTVATSSQLCMQVLAKMPVWRHLKRRTR